MKSSNDAQAILETLIEVRSDAEILDTLVERLVAGDEIKGARWIHLVFARMLEHLDALHTSAIDDLFAAIHEEQNGMEGARKDGERLPF